LNYRYLQLYTGISKYLQISVIKLQVSVKHLQISVIRACKIYAVIYGAVRV